MQYKFYDPLKYKMIRQLRNLQKEVYFSSRFNYGTKEDMVDLINDVNEDPISEGQFRVFDFTPFDQCINIDYFFEAEKLGKNDFVFLISKDIFYYLQHKVKGSQSHLVLFDKDGKFEYISEGENKERFLLSINEFKKRENRINSISRNNIFDPSKSLQVERKKINELFEFRQYYYTQDFLCSLLELKGVQDKPNSYSEKDEKIIIIKENGDTPMEVQGKKYIKMDNGMLVSSYIQLRELAQNQKFVFDLIYEIILYIVDYFNRTIQPLDFFDYFVVSNHTSYLISSLFQLILKKPVVIIDKLGPKPNYPSVNTYPYLWGKRVILIEEVLATGSETDRALLFLNQLRTKVNCVLAFYNLQAGKPLLVDEENIISFCFAKEFLKYVYRSQ